MSLIPSGKLTCSGVFTCSGGDMFEIIRRALEALLSLPREVSPTPGSYPQCVIRENGKVVLLLWLVVKPVLGDLVYASKSCKCGKFPAHFHTFGVNPKKGLKSNCSKIFKSYKDPSVACNASLTSLSASLSASRSASRSCCCILCLADRFRTFNVDPADGIGQVPK